MFVVFRPFVFHTCKSLKRGLRDRDWVCDATASLLSAAIQHRQAIVEGLDFVGSVKSRLSRG